MGAAAQAARERARRALACPQDLRRDRAPRTRALVPLPDQQMAQQQDELAGRPPRAAGRRGHRSCAGGGDASAERAGRAAARRKPAAFGDAQQTLSVAGHSYSRFRLVLASAGGTRLLAAMGAESYKI